MVYGHYAAMGGFATDVEHIHNVAKRATLTTAGLLFLARRGKFCRVNRSHIQDKSKADILAKGLVCIQVLWVAGQVIERKLAGYPMTLLEIHTLVHVVCALVMYGLWAQKPLNVQDPTSVSFEDDPATLAFMLETAQYYFPKRYGGFKTQHRHGHLHGEECSMSLLNAVEPQSIYIENIIEKAEGLPRIVTERAIREDDRDLVHISTYYHLTSKDNDGTSHHYPMSLYLDSLTPASNEPIVCTIFTGQILTFSGLVSSAKIGPPLPPSRPVQQGRGNDGSKIEFIYKGRTIEATELYPAITISLTQKDIGRLSKVAE
jgi:hypothetical protein